ncbi:hypothetical protein KPH14_012968, partial [Odynerus spinipes]
MSYLDIGLIDGRLGVSTNEAGQVRALTYDSDHNALEFIVVPEKNIRWEVELIQEAPRYNYSATNWHQFQKYLQRIHRDRPPIHRNLSIKEIDEYILKIEHNIVKAIEDRVPKVKHRETTECYRNNKIRKLEKVKSSLITQLNKIYRKFDNYNNPRIELIKLNIATIKELLNLEYRNSINSYWRNKIINIPINKPRQTFPLINQIFRPKGKAKIIDIDLNADAISKHSWRSADKPQIPQGNDTARITDSQTILEILGEHFASVHTQNEEMGKSGLTNIVNHVVEEIKEQITADRVNNSTFTQFHAKNTALKPNLTLELPFISNTIVLQIFRKLNLKKSAGIDQLPNI